MYTEMRDLQNLWREAFGDNERFIRYFFMFGHSIGRRTTAHIDGQLAGAMYWFKAYAHMHKYAYLYGIATAEKFRGQGVCRAMVERTLKGLQREGFQGACLVPESPELFGLYEKLGFRPCTTIREFTVEAGQPMLFRKIDRYEYLRLRHARLPAGGLQYNDPFMTYVAFCCDFYASPDFLLCAYREGDVLRVQEYFGDPALAPRITATLGAKTGIFRTPGTDKPFSMYYPITDAPWPNYVGLPMD